MIGGYMKRRFSGLPAVITICTLLVLGAGNIFGQAISGDVTGAVFDSTGLGIPGAAVTAENQATGVKTTSAAGPDGVYRFNNLPVGTYTITGSAPKFSSASVKNQDVVLNTTVTANLTLQVGSTSTAIEVTAAPPPLDTTTAQLQTTFGSNEIQDLPVATYSRTAGYANNGMVAAIWNLSLLGAGVASNGGVGFGVGPAVGGQRPENNTYFLDGVNNNNLVATGPLTILSNDAVAEVTVLQNQFNAEFGGASGGVFNAIVKSGTNQLHGSVYEYFQNRNLDAVDALDWTQGLTSLPRFDNNRLGATVGGPIVKNKVFYFGNFEYNPIGQAALPGAPVAAPTAAGYSLLASNPQVSSNNLGVLQKYLGSAPSNNAGTVAVGGANIPLGSIPILGPSYDNSYNAVMALDYNVSDKDQIRGRWIYNKTSGIDTNTYLPTFYQTEPNSTYQYSLSEFHSFSPTLQNEFRVAFGRAFNLVGDGNQTFPGLNVFPNIDLTASPLNVVLGPDISSPDGIVQNLFQAQDNVTKIWGRHTLKFGYNFADTISSVYFIQYVRGYYEYSTLQQYLYDLQPDSIALKSSGPSYEPAGFLQNSIFANDDFRVRPNLTVNLGLRWEYVTTPVALRYQALSALASVPGGLTFASPNSSPNDWSPRIGYAYSPGKGSVWSIRGGFSRSFDLPYSNLIADEAPPVFLNTQECGGGSCPGSQTGFLASGGLPSTPPCVGTTVAAARGCVTTYTEGGKRPYGITWTQGIQRRLGKDYTVEVRYTGTKGVHLYDQSRLNIVPQVNASNKIPTFFTMPSAATFASLGTTLGQVQKYVVPGGTAAEPYNDMATLGFTSPILAFSPEAYSSYNGLAVQMTKRYSNNFQYIAAYTWSHMLDDASGTFSSTALTPRRAQNFQDMAAEWASSALDRRQRLTFTPVYDWRPFSNGNWVMKNVVGNWNISGTYTYQSPEYVTPQSQSIDDASLTGNAGIARTIINPGGAATAGTGVTAYNAAGQPVSPGDPTTVAYVANNPNARYVLAGFGALANAGRNTLAMKPTNNIDMSILKRFAVTERVRMEVGAQFFNVLNHAQFTGGLASDVAPYGAGPNASYLTPGNPGFGRFDQFYTSNPRVGQLSMHITF
jgi:hypothetical protein